MREIQYEIVKEIAVLSTGDSGYTKEINLISWNGKEPKYDIRSFSPNREKCGKGITLNADDGKYFFSLLVLIFKVSFWLPFSSVIIANIVSMSSRPLWLNCFIR